MKKLLVLMIFFISFIYSQNNFQVGISSGIGSSYHELSKFGGYYSVKFSYDLFNKLSTYLSYGHLSATQYRSEFLDSYMTLYTIGLKYKLYNDSDGVYLLAECDYSKGYRIDDMEDLYPERLGRYFKTIKREIDSWNGVFGVGYDLTVAKNLQITFDSAITMFGFGKGGVPMLRLTSGLNYRF